MTARCRADHCAARAIRITLRSRSAIVGIFTQAVTRIVILTSGRLRHGPTSGSAPQRPNRLLGRRCTNRSGGHYLPSGSQ
jgi:hypothetical protein